MHSLVQSDRSLLSALPESDQLLLDEAFERALASWEQGISIPPADLFQGRPDLRDHAEQVLALVQDVAVTGPAPWGGSPTPTVPGYTLLSELGRGAMGAVYLARQDRLGGRSVALKVLPSGATISSRARDRFQAEANAIARLRHPHIVTVYDVVREATLLAFAMEPVDGPSLHEVIDHLAALGRAPRAGDVRALMGAGSSALSEEPYWTFVARLGAAVAKALQAVHDAGLLHRDVKPSNILLRRDGTPLLSDFGLVHDPESGVVTRDGFVGTPAYAPPEQLAGGPGAADVRSDVYALGATLYHALALGTPFAANTPAAMLELARRGAPPLTSRSPSTPRDLATIIAKAMAPSAKDRYASAAQLADDLDRLLSQRPILARPAGILSRSIKLLRRNRQAFWGTIGGAIGVLVLVGALIMGFVLMPRWSVEARERAWLTLLDPRDTELFANTAFWETHEIGPPRINRAVVTRALAEYNTAMRWQPWDKRTQLERDVLVAMLSVSEESPSPWQLSPSLSRRAPLACAWLEKWTHSGVTATSPPLPLNLTTPDELIAIGLMSYVTTDMKPAVTAWLRLETLGDPGPFVRAGLGLYFVYAQEPARAYPRLQAADRAFRTVSFLRAAHAEAACAVGDSELAALLLHQASTLPMSDSQQLLRVGTLVDLALGRPDAALDRFASWYFVSYAGGSGVSGFQVGRWLAAYNQDERALSVLSLYPASSPKWIELFMPLAERWWDSLTDARRLEILEEAISTRCGPVPWGLGRVPMAYAWTCRDIAAQPHLAGLRSRLTGHALAQCGQRLEPHFQPSVSEPPRLSGEELTQEACRILGLKSDPRRPEP